MTLTAELVTPPHTPGHPAGEQIPTQIEVFEASQRGHALAIWRHVEDRLDSVPIMASAEWTATWLNHYGEGLPHRFYVLQRDSEFLAIALLVASGNHRIPWTGERIWHCGTAGEPDADSVCVEYNAFLCAPEVRDEFASLLFRHLQEESDWDAICLEGFADEDLPEFVKTSSQFQLESKLARWTNLEAVRESGRELMSVFGDSTRKNIRQSVRKLDSPRFEWAETREHAHRIFDDLITLHQQRWNAEGKPGCYASRQFTAFHRDLIDRMAPHRMILARVSNSAQVIGCSQLLIDRGRALVYQGGRIPNLSCSPGLVTDFLVMEECFRRGYSAYDFMAGDSMHKRRLTDSETPLCWATWRRRRWKYQVVDALRSGRRWVRTLLGKQFSPVPQRAADMKGGD